MSTDPYATTSSVKNILQHLVSPKIVNDGSGGYVVKTDLVNVDNIVSTGNIQTTNLTTSESIVINAMKASAGMHVDDITINVNSNYVNFNFTLYFWWVLFHRAVLIFFRTNLVT